MKGRHVHTQTAVLQQQGYAPVLVTIKHNYVHSAPMSYTDREDAYYAQNWPNRRGLTVRQERQLRKTEKRSIYRGKGVRLSMGGVDLTPYVSKVEVS